jgi:hypothetical protein
MDAAHLTQLLALAAGVFAIVRFVLGTLDRAEAGFASLFVPPDRTLGWPRGVQESDAPWGWQPPVDPRDDDSADTMADLASYAVPLVLSGHTTYVERPHLVAPVRFRALPQ